MVAVKAVSTITEEVRLSARGESDDGREGSSPGAAPRRGDAHKKSCWGSVLPHARASVRPVRRAPGRVAQARRSRKTISRRERPRVPKGAGVVYVRAIAAVAHWTLVCGAQSEPVRAVSRRGSGAEMEMKPPESIHHRCVRQEVP